MIRLDGTTEMAGGIGVGRYGPSGRLPEEEEEEEDTLESVYGGTSVHYNNFKFIIYFQVFTSNSEY